MMGQFTDMQAWIIAYLSFPNEGFVDPDGFVCFGFGICFVFRESQFRIESEAEYIEKWIFGEGDVIDFQV